MQRRSTFISVKFIQHFNQQNSSHVIYVCKNFTEAKLNAKNINTAKSTTKWYKLSKVIGC